MAPRGQLVRAADALSQRLRSLTFSAPVTHVYNPLVYARARHADYLQRYGKGKKLVVFLGMNPGPFGMAQTGVPFGEVALVREWLGIHGPVDKPESEHPKRPIEGFACTRSEVSGRRLWGAIRERFGQPETFFSQHFVSNYCPLVFMEQSGKNRTPNKLPEAERTPLFEACDQHLRAVVETLSPEWVVGVGKFAEGRALAALHGMKVQVGAILHPSPASPLANQGWSERASEQLAALGIAFRAHPPNRPLR